MCKLGFYLFKVKMYRMVAVPCPTTWWQCDTPQTEQLTSSVQSLAAGPDIPPLEEGAGA